VTKQRIPIREWVTMRLTSGLKASLFGAALALTHPFAAAAQDDPSWRGCIATQSAPSDRVAACSAVIDGNAETGRRLAAAYCNRGHGLTEAREFDRALADLDEAIRIDPAYACAYSNRGQVMP
jgi:hypothetical protein